MAANSLALQLAVSGAPAVDAALGRVEGAANDAARAARGLGNAGEDAGDGLRDAGRVARSTAPAIDSVGDAANDGSDAFAGLGGAAEALAGPLAVATAGAAAFFGVWEAAKDAAKLKTAERELGQLGVSLDRLRNSAGGLVERADLIEFASAIGRAGFADLADTAVQAAVALNSSGVEMKQALDKIKGAFIENKPEQLVEEFGLSIEKTGDAATDLKNTVDALNQVIADSGGVTGNALRFYTALEDSLWRMAENAARVADQILRVGSYRPEDLGGRLQEDILDSAAAAEKLQKRIARLREELKFSDAMIATRSGFTRTGDQARRELAEAEDQLRAENSKKLDLQRQFDAHRNRLDDANEARRKAAEDRATAEGRAAIQTRLEDLKAAGSEEAKIRLRVSREVAAIQAMSVGSDEEANAQKREAISLIQMQGQADINAIRAKAQAVAEAQAKVASAGQGSRVQGMVGAASDMVASFAEVRADFAGSLDAEREAARLASMSESQRAMEELRLGYVARMQEINDEAARAELIGSAQHKERLLLNEADYEMRLLALQAQGQEAQVVQQSEFSRMVQGLQEQLFTASISGFADMFTAMIAGQEINLPMILAGFVDTFGQILIQFGTMLILLGAGFSALGPVMPNFGITGAAAVAAGTAAVAGGILMRGAAGAIRASQSENQQAAFDSGGPAGFGGSLQPPNKQGGQTIIINIEGGLDTSDDIARRVAKAVKRGNELGFRTA